MEERIDEIIDGCHDYIRGVRTDHLIGISKKKAHAAIKRIVLEGRRDERKAVALDNYHGHTFSDSTDWQGKFQKFIDNNEKRIAALNSQIEGLEKK